MSRSRIALLLGAITALAIGASACSSAKADSQGAPPSGSSSDGVDLSKVTLNIGATGWNVQGAALDVAGLQNTPYKIKWSVFSGGNKQMEALQAGALDVGGASEIPPVFAAANVTPKWKAVVSGHATTLLQEVVVGKGSDITGIAQLKGKKVGYVQNTTAQYFLAELLQQSGLKWSDIKAAPLLPSDGVAALKGGSIDAFASYGNSIITIHQQGGTTIGSGENILSGNYVYLVTDSVLDDPAKKAAAADYFARVNKAYAIIRAGKEREFAEKTAEATKQPVDQALSQLQAGETQRPTEFVPESQSAIDSEQKVADVFTQLGSVKKVDVASFWSDALNADLSAALAKYPTTAGASSSTTS